MTIAQGEIETDDLQPWHRVVLLPKNILDNPPSRKDNIDWETEFNLRIYGCELIQEAGILLRLPQVVLCTGQSILQRFYYRKSLMKFDPFTVAMSCVLLSTKIEECIGANTKVRDIILVFHRMYLRRRELEIQFLELNGLVYKEIREEMNRVERHILKELGFGFYNIMDHPHRFILYHVKVLDWGTEPTQKAWNYLNDSLRTDLCLRYRAEMISCAAIYMSARSLNISLPQNPPWWKLFNANIKEIGEICNVILSLYKRPKLTWIEPLNSNSMFAPGKCLRRRDESLTPGAISPINERWSAVKSEKVDIENSKETPKANKDKVTLEIEQFKSSQLSSPPLPPRKFETPLTSGQDGSPQSETSSKLSSKMESPTFLKTEKTPQSIDIVSEMNEDAKKMERTPKTNEDLVSNEDQTDRDEKRTDIQAVEDDKDNSQQKSKSTIINLSHMKSNILPSSSRSDRFRNIRNLRDDSSLNSGRSQENRRYSSLTPSNIFTNSRRRSRSADRQPWHLKRNRLSAGRSDSRRDFRKSHPQEERNLNSGKGGSDRRNSPIREGRGETQRPRIQEQRGTPEKNERGINDHQRRRLLPPNERRNDGKQGNDKEPLSGK